MFDTAFNMGYLGLQSQSERLAAISDNIANVKTTGYKRTDVRFVELMNDSRNPQPNLRLTHVRPSPHQFLGIQGELSLSEVETNVAVDGKGLFIINTKADGTGQTYFTRDGTFAPDYQGYYVNKGGGYLQGFPTTATTLSDSSTQTNIARTATAVSGLTTVRTPRDSIIQAASATTTASASGNVPLIATQTVGTTYAHDLAVYDNLNGVHDIRLTWTATATGYTLAASSADGTVTINGGASTPVTVGTTTSAVIGVTWTNPATASASSITLNLSSLQTGQSTQFTATAAATNGNIDGYVKSLSWDEYGQVNAVLTNGNISTVGQLALASFTEQDKLEAQNSTNYRLTSEAGTMAISAAQSTSKGTGIIAGGQLEQANADLAAELTDLIVVQRSYSFNATVLRTADEMTRVVVDLKR